VKGIAHVGAIEVLEKAGIVPDLIVGCSAGAVAGGLYAAKQDIAHAKEIGLEMSSYTRNYHLFGLPSLYRGFFQGAGYFSMKNIKKYLSEAMQVNKFEDLRIPLVTVATNLQDGTVKQFSSGPVIDTICASGAIPGLFQPVKIDNVPYVDGFLVSPFPARVAKQLGAKIIIGVVLSSSLDRLVNTEITSVAYRSFELLTRNLIKEEVAMANIIITPELKNVGFLLSSYNGAIKIYEAGKRAAEKMLGEIQTCISIVEEEERLPS
jgi:NTE family protein